MSVSLQKGQKVNLSKEHAGLAKVIVGLGWDEAKPSGGGGLFGALFGSSSHQAIDCDASAIMLKKAVCIKTGRKHCICTWYRETKNSAAKEYRNIRRLSGPFKRIYKKTAYLWKKEQLF